MFVVAVEHNSLKRGLYHLSLPRTGTKFKRASIVPAEQTLFHKRKIYEVKPLEVIWSNLWSDNEIDRVPEGLLFFQRCPDGNHLTFLGLPLFFQLFWRLSSLPCLPSLIFNCYVGPDDDTQPGITDSCITPTVTLSSELSSENTQSWFIPLSKP